MADDSSEPPLLNSRTSTMNPYELLGIVHNPDADTLARNSPNPITNSNDDPDTKDIDLNPKNKTWIRIFKPSQSQKTELLPLIIYFHGGGFIRCNANSTIFHNFCKSMANQLSAVVLSIEYRLAPENRLPAAYEDAVESLIWVQNQALDTINGEPWLRNYVDFSKCFIMGCSAGGNIAYNSCLRASELDLEPIKICGLILNQPYFGGVERSKSELRLVNDMKLPLVVNDLLWELGLPVGVNRDHVYCNPFVDENLERKLRLIRRCLVTCSNEDPLVDRDIQFVKMLEEKGLKVMSWIEEFGFHGMAHSDPVKAQELLKVVKDFIFSED
ncbi:carboxylesterase 1-like [Papaver somniferum]|uniref:carboxylesterase 1-like n=1 Tax=Papaver somniferum TaxID=3469 RepID=UPI000E6F76D4|nr:carboxylesterase 1-like [Papaver somniferum]